MGRVKSRVEEIILSDNIYNDFLREALKYPLLSNEETNNLISRVQQGDNVALDKLIKSNLRLIIMFAKEFQSHVTNLDIMDLIQEGTIGFITAVHKFDPELGKFSTYASIWIKSAIQKAKFNMDDSIRKSIVFNQVQARYKKVVQDFFAQGKKVPSDKALCEILNISQDTLNAIKNSEYLNPLSLEYSNEDAEINLNNIISSGKDYVEEAILQNDTNRLLVVIKTIFSPLQYYVIYNHILFKEYTLDDLGKKLGISSERVRKIEEEALEKIKPYLKENSVIFRRVLQKYKEENIKIEDVNVNPIDPINIIRYLYIKQELNDDQIKLLWLQWFGQLKFTKSFACKNLNWPLEKLMVVDESLKEKITAKFKDKERFELFASNILNAYGTGIFSVIDSKATKKNYNEDLCDNMDIAAIIDCQSIAMLPWEEALLRRFYNLQIKRRHSKYDIEKDIYLTVFGFKYHTDLSKNKLYLTFLNNKDKFTLEQSFFLECFLHKNNINLFLSKYPASKLPTNFKFLIIQLEMLYYKIDELFDGGCTKEMYLKVKSTMNDKLSDRRIKLLNLYFGCGCNLLTISEISELLQEDYNKIHGEIYSALEYIKNAYYGNAKILREKDKKYLPYITNAKYEYTEETRRVLFLYFVKEFSYEEIGKFIGLSKTKVANIICEGLKRVDLYRFGIIKPTKIEESVLKEFFKSSYCNLSFDEKNVVIFKKSELKSNEEIIQKFGMTKSRIDKIINKFMQSYAKYLTINTIIDAQDILDEIAKDNIESVLSEEEKQIISLSYGFQNIYNPQGLKCSIVKIAEILNYSADNISDKINNAVIKIKLRKIGLLMPELLFIPKEELVKIMDDKHLPLSTYEKDLICYLFGLNNYPVKTIEELASLFNRSISQIKRTYKLAVLSILKYLNNEIKGAIDFESDVLPNLKYFSKRDALFLIETYKNQLTREELSNKYGLSIHVVNRLMAKNNNYLDDILLGYEKNRFDFSAYRALIGDPMLPYNGNKNLARKCFELLYGESTMECLQVSDVVIKLNLNCSNETIRRHIKLIILSIFKLQDGIRRKNVIDDKCVREYYELHSENMTLKELQSFNKYFAGTISKSEFTQGFEGINDGVIFALLKDQNPDFFNLDTATREDIELLLLNYYKDLNPQTVNALIQRFGLDERNYMSQIEINEALKLTRKIVELN